jgi:hypothetical protein
MTCGHAVATNPQSWPAAAEFSLKTAVSLEQKVELLVGSESFE